MSKDRGKNKRKQRQIIKPEKQIANTVANNISKEDMIEIQTEAYYRALKRVQLEKADMEEQEMKPEEIKKLKWPYNLLAFFNVIFLPWIINKRFVLKKQMYNDALVLAVSLMTKIIGTFIWLLGITQIIVYFIYFKDNLIFLFYAIPLGVVTTFCGSMFILSGNSFSKETDNNNIYAYSACIFALISCIVSILALMKN